MLVYRQSDYGSAMVLAHREIARFVSQIAGGRLQVQRYRIVDLGLDPSGLEITSWGRL